MAILGPTITGRGVTITGFRYWSGRELSARSLEPAARYQEGSADERIGLDLEPVAIPWSESEIG